MLLFAIIFGVSGLFQSPAWALFGKPAPVPNPQYLTEHLTNLIIYFNL